MSNHALSSAKPAQDLRFLVLAGHGLQTPLSSIRWGVQRLRKTDTKQLSKQQKHLIDSIDGNARTLSRVLSSMLLLARNEEHTYTLGSDDIGLAGFFKQLAQEAKEEGIALAVSVPATLTLTADPHMFSTVMENLLSVFSESASAPKKVKLSASRTGTDIHIVCETAMEFPLLSGDGTQDVNKLVGGTSGLMLSLAHSLVGFLDGDLVMTSLGKDRYKLTVAIPLAD